MSWKKDSKVLKFQTDNRVICKCGHRILIKNRFDRVICTHCGKMVYLHKKDEFKDKIKGAIKRANI